jgi:hypothetical protein
VIDGVEGCRQIKQREQDQVPGIHAAQQVVQHPQNSSLGAMGRTIRRLERVEEVVVLKMGMQLSSDNALKEFGDIWQIGDRAVILREAGIKGGLLQ